MDEPVEPEVPELLDVPLESMELPEDVPELGVDGMLEPELLFSFGEDMEDVPLLLGLLGLLEVPLAPVP
ncbi:MAG TPA: hypothetical protein VJ698_17910 [Noviherbaspirillum sp.]|uniref:hypothetical protein n=1 Tax=Noviherbaspirillum sp. TaxID=1926288 RepID=UPI002B47DAAC|nr:hypothetical protein [Noviherbaspirillum sp.]HJV87348.1 hypothetical protein [Noviherbaspirillum sp.]